MNMLLRRGAPSGAALAAFLGTIGFEAPALAQRLGQGSEASTVSYGQVVGVILFLLVLIVSAWFVVRARGGGFTLLANPADKRLRVIETVRLSPNATLCLAQLDETEYLVAFTAQGAQLLDKHAVAGPGGAA